MIPNIEYTIKLNNQSIALGGRMTCSFNPPYNKVDITFKSTNTSLTAFVIRVSKQGQDVSPYEGNLVLQRTNIAMNTLTSVSFNITSSLFNQGDGVYVIGLYGLSADNKWDSTLLFITSEGYNFVPSGSNGLEVIEEPE